MTHSVYPKDTEEKDIAIGVLADVHVMSEKQAVNMTCADFKAWEAHGQKMLGLSESLLKTAVDRIISESDLDVVLVSGDNSDDGGEISHRAVSAELKRLEKAGIKVYTIPGNHDINNKSYTYANGKAAYADPTTEQEFAEIYADFGYNTADSLEFYKRADASDGERRIGSFRIGDNLSYVADLSDKYRLIAIDMCKYVSDCFLTDDDGNEVLFSGERYPLVSGRHDGAMTEELLLWAKAKIEEAIAAGKIPLGMMHFPLLQHFGPLVQTENGAVNDPFGYSVADVLADAGMKFIFTGHIHIQDDALYLSENGNRILDINSASLCNYPTPIRIFRAKGEEVYVRTWNMDYIAEDYLPTYLSEEERGAVLRDFGTYSVKYLDDSMLAKIKNKIEPDTMVSLLAKLGVKKDGTNDAAVDALANGIYRELFLKFLKLPIYEKDAGGGLSVEKAAKSYGVSLPTSGYTDVFNLAMSFVAGVYGGDERCSADEVRATLLKYSIFSAFYMIDDYDLFGKIKALNPSFADIDLSVTLSDLFIFGNLDVCESNLLVGIVGSLDIDLIKRFLNFDDKINPYAALESLKTLAKTLKLETLLLGLDVREYIVVDKTQKVGVICLSDLLDGIIGGKLSLGLLNDSIANESIYNYESGATDSAPPDNDLKINMTTMAYTALK